MEEIGQLTLQTQPALIHFLDNAMSPVLLKTLAQGAAETPCTALPALRDI